MSSVGQMFEEILKENLAKIDPATFRYLTMAALDSYKDNLCLWRCIAVHQGARVDRSTKAARSLAKSFYKLKAVPSDYPKTSLDELDKVEAHLNQGAVFSSWLGIRVYEPERREDGEVV